MPGRLDLVNRVESKQQMKTCGIIRRKTYEKLYKNATNIQGANLWDFSEKEENEKAIDLKVIEGNGCAKESKGRIKTKIE